MDDDEGRTVSMRQYTLACNQATDFQRQLQQAQDRLTTKLGEVNTTNRLNTDVLRRERDVAIERGVAVIQAAQTLAYQRHMARLSQGWWYRRFGEAQERAEVAEALVEKLRKAGVTDYSTLGSNCVDCRFCNGVWRADEPAKHKKGCPLAAAEAQEEGG